MCPSVRFFRRLRVLVPSWRQRPHGQKRGQQKKTNKEESRQTRDECVSALINAWTTRPASRAKQRDTKKKAGKQRKKREKMEMINGNRTSTSSSQEGVKLTKTGHKGSKILCRIIFKKWRHGGEKTIECGRETENQTERENQSHNKAEEAIKEKKKGNKQTDKPILHPFASIHLSPGTH